MGIKSYRKDEKMLWRVYVNVRSKENPALRVQKNVSGLESKAEAMRAEKQLLAEAALAIGKKEGKGATWRMVCENGRWKQKRD